MNKREADILGLFVANKNKIFTSKEVAGTFQISDRTVKKDIKNINAEISAYGIQIQSKPGKGMWLEDDYPSAKVTDLQEEDAEIARRKAIAKILIEEKDYISAEKISNLIFYSTSTILRDLDFLDAFFGKYSIHIDRQIKKGIRLIGEEKNLRLAKAELLLQSVKQNAQFTENLQQDFPSIKITRIMNLISSIENKYGFFLTDISKQALIIHTAITIQRIRNKQFISMPVQQIGLLKKEAEWVIAADYMNQLEQEFAIEMTEDECSFIVVHLLSSSLSASDTSTEAKREKLNELDPYLFTFMQRALEELSIKYKIPFDQDNKLETTLFLHLKPMLNRLRNGISLDNPWRQEIKKNNHFAYEIAADLAQIISSNYAVKIGDSEISYLALYIGASTERMAEIENDFEKVVLICASGAGTSQYLKQRIKKLFPALNVIGVYALHEVKNIAEDFDFIISTVQGYELDENNRDIVYVSPVLNEKDIEKIDQKIRRKQTSLLSSLIQEDITLLGQEAVMREEVIGRLAHTLEVSGYVDKGFYHSVLKREELSSTAIGNGFAIPHAYQGHILKKGIAFMQLKTPIFWGEVKVQFVFMLAMDMESQVNFERLFGELMQLSENKDLVEGLKRADHYQTLMTILNHGEIFHAN